MGPLQLGFHHRPSRIRCLWHKWSPQRGPGSNLVCFRSPRRSLSYSNRTLADRDDRGKLNIAEFHVAMALIYRRASGPSLTLILTHFSPGLNGTPIPDTLPHELIPPSARDLDSSVDMLKDLLKNEPRSRSPSLPVSRLKNRSFTTDSPSLESARDATIYKHTDQEPLGGIYKPRNRHINRDDVKGRRQDDSPSADIDEMKRQLANTAKMLDDQALADASTTAEDEALDREMDDLRYRVGRVQDDLDYLSRGPRSAAKDLDKRKLEREMLNLMHERIPELERKIKARDERREMEKRQWTRDRNRANERFGRFEPRDSSRRYDDHERPYSRGYDRSRDRYENREREPERQNEVQSPPPKIPSPAPLSVPTAPQPSLSPTPNLKNMSQAERSAYMKAEAQRRVQARMAALGVTPSASPALDSGVEDRLQQEKKEAEEKAKAAEKQAEERERLRRERLESEKAAREGTSSPVTRNVPPPKTAPPTPAKRPPVPPPPRRAPAPPHVDPTPPVPTPPVPPVPVQVPVPEESEIDPEEEALRAREETIKKRHAERVARLRQLEEEEEKGRLEEEQYQARLRAMKTRQAPPPKAPSPAPVAVELPVTPAVPPPAPVVTSPAAASDKSTTNPFSRLIQERSGGGGGGIMGSVGSNESVSTNPWTKSTVSPVPRAKSPSFVPPQPSKSPAPPVVKTDYQTASSGLDDEDWGDVNERESEDSSSEDEYTKSREKRADIAQQLFGRPVSEVQRVSTPSSPAVVGGSGISSPAPPVPPVPPAPSPPASAPPAPAPAATGGNAPTGIGALLGDIRGGLKLKPTQTVDKSGPSVSGRVVGSSNTASSSQPIDEPHTVPEPIRSDKMDHRQSVDWFATRAADHVSSVGVLPGTAEVDEEEEEEGSLDRASRSSVHVPAIQVDETPVDMGSDLMADIDESIGEFLFFIFYFSRGFWLVIENWIWVEYYTLTKYSFEGEGREDLCRVFFSLSTKALIDGVQLFMKMGLWLLILPSRVVIGGMEGM